MSAKTESAEAHPKGLVYSVCVRSILDEGWVRALDVEPVATHRHYSGPARTVLTLRFTDQAEMLSLLNRLHNMSLSVLSVVMVQPGKPYEKPPEIWEDM